jgi:hypothetical protein
MTCRTELSADNKISVAGQASTAPQSSNKEWVTTLMIMHVFQCRVWVEHHQRHKQASVL